MEGVRGTISFHASIDPRPDYARLAPSPKFRSRLGWSYAWRNEILNVHTDIELAQETPHCAGNSPYRRGSAVISAFLTA